jgi:predicted  nucleic acid-binding Zn-ribbon protein
LEKANDMGQALGTETCQRLARWIEEANWLIGVIPQLLDENERLRASAVAAAKERERLREEINRLRSEGQQFRQAMNDIQKVMSRIASMLTEKKRPLGPAGRS